MIETVMTVLALIVALNLLALTALTIRFRRENKRPQPRPVRVDAGSRHYV